MSLSEFTSGAIFGAALFSAGVFTPVTVKSQMTFQSNKMLTVFLGASATSAIIMDIEDRLKLFTKKHRAPSNFGMFLYDGNVIGGALIGIGMAVTGACPGTALVQVGAGMLDGVLVLLGGVVGAMAYIKLRPILQRLEADALEASATAATERSPDHAPISAEKNVDMASAFGIQPFVLLLIWVPMCLAVMQIAFKVDQGASALPTFGLVRPAFGGLLIGVAQLATTLLTGHAIGASRAYEDVAKWVEAKVRRKHSKPPTVPSFFTPSVIFSGGVVLSAATMSHLFVRNGSLGADSLTTINPKSAAQAIVGGMSMVLGARIAGGCTSGHGISGLAKFSMTSLVTTAAMFAAGIATAQLVGR